MIILMVWFRNVIGLDYMSIARSSMAVFTIETLDHNIMLLSIGHCVDVFLSIVCISMSYCYCVCSKVSTQCLHTHTWKFIFP